MSKQYLDYEGLKEYDNLIKQYVADHAGSAAEPYDDSAIVDDLNALKALVGDTAVADQINTAIISLVNGAPNSLDTLKEIADWISTHGESASDLVGVVAEQGQQITELNSKVDAIAAISGTYIEALFLTPVTIQDGQTVQDAIIALGEGEKLVLTAPVTEDLTINKDAVIEADGVVFSGTITVDKAAAVTVIGAEFTGQVVVA